MASPKSAFLEQLTRPELQAIAEQYQLVVADHRVRSQLVEAAAASRKVRLSEVLHGFSRDRLKELCRALVLDDSGKEKLALVARLVAASTRGSETYALPVDEHVLQVRESVAAYAPKPRREGVAAKKPGNAKERKRSRKRTVGVESEAAVSGSLKAALRQFAAEVAGGYSGRDAHLNFTTHFLECFGWPGGQPKNAEIPRTFAIADAGRRMEREIALWWPERRTMMDVVPRDAVLDFAWKDVLRVCLQLDPVPQYVVLTNQRDIRLYDLARDREAPRLAIPMDDLPRYSEAFPFFTTEWKPGDLPKIVNVEKVSSEVADLVARLYRSVRAKHPQREHDVIRFTLQCITAMFAEDIGLLPKNYFTSLLYDGAKSGDVEQRIRRLFEQMNTREVPGARVVPYFNGGLFTDVTTLALGPDQLIALTKAAEANWAFVDPHIFGSVFQGIMDDAERHAQGAHYTAQDDIMRVVGPTIVEPWRKRIRAATSLKELTDLRKELLAYRVLDPACGSGNFLYVAFRELYRLDTELLSRMRDFPSTTGKLSWNGGISARNFYGIDINPFAVELAKVTLNIAKKIAYEERKAQAFALGGQVEMNIDPSLPLDNLDNNISCADALFNEWPQADAIVSNPPFLGGTRIRGELGEDYLRRLLARFPDVEGRTDLCAYWFRLAHDHLMVGGRAGLVGTSGIRVGKAREASLDYLVTNGGTITNAVSSREWPGEAAVNVSMVNWLRGLSEGPHQLLVEDETFLVDRIPTHLQLHADVSIARNIAVNAAGMAEGVSFGHPAFRSGGAKGFSLALVQGKSCFRPVATGDDLLRGRLSTEPDYCIDLRDRATEGEAKIAGGQAFEHLKAHVFRAIKERAESTDETDHYKSWLRYWWKPHWGREEFFATIAAHTRLLVCPKVSSRPAFAFISMRFVPNDTMKLFGFDDDYSFGVMQSRLHWEWSKARGSKVRSDIQYTAAVWRTFPWPQEPTDAQVAAVAAAARGVQRVRATLMQQNSWSLRALYQAAEVEGPHPLKDAQAALDVAVTDAYGMPPNQSVTEFLLELNELVAEDEEQGRRVHGPGLPDHLDKKDARWMSADCIEPPAID